MLRVLAVSQPLPFLAGRVVLAVLAVPQVPRVTD